MPSIENSAIQKMAKRAPVYLEDGLAFGWDLMEGDIPVPHVLHIMHEDDPMDPREADGHVSEMAFFHKRYDLGDSQWRKKEPSDFLFCLLEGDGALITESELDAAALSGAVPGFTYDPDDGEGRKPSEQLVEFILDGAYSKGIALLSEEAAILPVQLYDHSGLTISLSTSYPYNDRFDAGTIGWCMVTKEKAMSELGASGSDWKEKAAACIASEIKEYDHYLRGESWGYEVKRMSEDEWEEVDACYGFLGDTLEGTGIFGSVGYGFEEAHDSMHTKQCTARAVRTITWEYDFDE